MAAGIPLELHSVGTYFGAGHRWWASGGNFGSCTDGMSVQDWVDGSAPREQTDQRNDVGMCAVRVGGDRVPDATRRKGEGHVLS